jgi:hypothetical protein
MMYRAYLFCEPGMDRPCFSHTPPTEDQKKRFAEKGTAVFSFDLDIPGFTVVDGVLQRPFLVPVPLT